jgi:hypothetical protein
LAGTGLAPALLLQGYSFPLPRYNFIAHNIFKRGAVPER